MEKEKLIEQLEQIYIETRDFIEDEQLAKMDTLSELYERNLNDITALRKIAKNYNRQQEKNKKELADLRELYNKFRTIIEQM